MWSAVRHSTSATIGVFFAVRRARVVPTSNVANADRLDRLRQRGFRLEYASMAWMTVEAAVAITAGVVASSIALVGFGLDSVI